MKILSLYIEAFGGLTKRSFELSDGFSEILDENGAGKSTLAAFIKAMLYGLDGTGITRDLTANEFALYRPWSGGRFGGTLTFKTAEGAFRIERYFEDKRGANKHLGEWRVIDTATEMETDAFGEEPGRMLFGVDGESFMRTAYLSSRGLTAERTGDISAKLGGLDGERWDMGNAEEALRLIDRRRTEIRTKTKQRHGTKLLDVAERELNTTNERITEATAALEAESRERQSIAVIEERLAAQSEKLNALTKIKGAADRRIGEEKVKKEQIAALSARLSQDKDEIAALSRHFPDAPPSPETLAALDADARAYSHLATTTEGEQMSHDALPTDDDIATLRTLIKEREDAKAALETLRVQDTDGTAGGAGHSQRGLFILGLIFLFLLPPLGIILLWQRAKRKAAEATEAEAIRRAKATEKERAEARLEAATTAAAAALSAVGLSPDASGGDIDALHVRVLEARLAAKTEAQNRARMAELAARIEGVLSAYRDLPATEAIGVRVDTLRELCRKLNEKQAMLVEHSTLLARLNADTAPAEAAVDTAEVEGMIAILKDAIAKDTTEAAAARERANGYRAIADALDELYDLRETQVAEVERLSKRLSVLDQAADILTEAKEALEARCLGGIRKRISTYTDRLLGKKFGEARLNTELALSFSEGGEGHSAEYFSTGLRAIGDICLRLALTDELYPCDPPPLILDDPFMALDENNLKQALALLSDLAATRQILYLTCHPSRSGKADM